jgi:hypothetical protein
MAPTERGKAFDQHEPVLTREEAEAAFAAGHAAISLRGIPCLDSDTIEYLAVKFALANGGFATVLLDRMAAAALRALIVSAESINWDGNALRAGSMPH